MEIRIYNKDTDGERKQGIEVLRTPVPCAGQVDDWRFSFGQESDTQRWGMIIEKCTQTAHAEDADVYRGEPGDESWGWSEWRTILVWQGKFGFFDLYEYQDWLATQVDMIKVDGEVVFAAPRETPQK